MVVILPSDPGSLDPHDNVMQGKHQSTRQIYETLVVYDETGKLVPWLAEKWGADVIRDSDGTALSEEI